MNKDIMEEMVTKELSTGGIAGGGIECGPDESKGVKPQIWEPDGSGELSLVRLKAMGAFVLILSLCFIRPLADLVGYALNTDLYSHTILIPLVSGYLIWGQRREVLHKQSNQTGLWPMFLGGAGIALLAGYGMARSQGWVFVLNDYLSVTILSYLMLLAAGVLMILGKESVRVMAFPLVFLIFMVPLPGVIIHGMELFFQYTSAEAANLLFLLGGTPVFRDGLSFHLPGITIEVAEECSGIRSSFVLFITSLLAGHMYLRSKWKKWVLALAFLPIGIVRNGIRIFTIAMLCVHVDPSMIDSMIHRRGGPLFFVGSLVPLFLLMIWFRRTERRNVKTKGR